MTTVDIKDNSVFVENVPAHLVGQFMATGMTCSAYLEDFTASESNYNLILAIGKGLYEVLGAPFDKEEELRKAYTEIRERNGLSTDNVLDKEIL